MDRFDMDTLRSSARDFADNVRSHREDAREHAELLLQRLKLQEYLDEKRENEKLKNILILLLGAISIAAGIVGIALVIRHIVAPDYLEDYDEYEDTDDADDADEFETED